MARPTGEVRRSSSRVNPVWASPTFFVVWPTTPERRTCRWFRSSATSATPSNRTPASPSCPANRIPRHSAHPSASPIPDRSSPISTITSHSSRAVRRSSSSTTFSGWTSPLWGSFPSPSNTCSTSASSSSAPCAPEPRPPNTRFHSPFAPSADPARVCTWMDWTKRTRSTWPEPWATFRWTTPTCARSIDSREEILSSLSSTCDCRNGRPHRSPGSPRRR
ncbi:unannotated protein [freshwater metagenome]|uniref:Unannotated protein n=1 Tax=freshwater metagenome TaxID=449393 RepID=A0A6J6GIA0_9ZZZZ